jgi:LPS sulfotransferase NodH
MIKITYLKDSNFVILCPSRSGSTMLVHLLRSHPQIWCNGEIFLNDNKVGALAGEYRKKILNNKLLLKKLENELERDIVKFTYKYAFDPQGKDLAGFKFKIDEYFIDEFRNIKNIIHQDTDLKILFLTRRNLLERYISWYVANYISKKTIITDKKAIPELPQINIPTQKCLENFHTILSLQKRVRDELDNHRVLEVFYEDLIEAPHQEHSKICAFLDVKQKKLHTPTQKIITKSMEKLIGNYLELKNFFQYTEFAYLFEE